MPSSCCCDDVELAEVVLQLLALRARQRVERQGLRKRFHRVRMILLRAVGEAEVVVDDRLFVVGAFVRDLRQLLDRLVVFLVAPAAPSSACTSRVDGLAHVRRLPPCLDGAVGGGRKRAALQRAQGLLPQTIRSPGLCARYSFMVRSSRGFGAFRLNSIFCAAALLDRLAVLDLRLELPAHHGLHSRRFENAAGLGIEALSRCARSRPR